MSRGRVSHGTIYVEASVDVDEVIGDIPTDELIAEVKRRNKGKPDPSPLESWPLSEFLDEMRELLLRRQGNDALALLERYAAPNIDRMEAAYRAIETAKALRQ